ncbi:hypothetical protein PG995_006584 [Apiospora arundinis]
MIEIGKGVAFNRGKPTSTIRAVKNVWYERVFAHVRHYKRFYIVFSVILVFSVTLVAVLPGAVSHHGVDQSAIAPTSTPSEVCVRSSFAANASWVGVYNPQVNPPQFQIVGSRDVTGCCRRCFDLQPPRRCNGWGYIKSMCSIVYDYPGEGTTPECPKGRPLVGISTGGGAGDFAGLGPCAMAG